MSSWFGKSWWAQRRRRQGLRALLLLIVVVIFIAPLLWTGLASLHVMPDDLASPPTWSSPPSLDSYVDVGVTTPTFAQAVAGSLGIAIAVTGLTVIISLPAAYSLARASFPGIRTLVQGFLVLASVPVMAFAIPLVIIGRTLHVFDSFGGVVLAESAFLAPLAVFVLFGYVRQVSPDLDQAAHMESANVWQTLWYIIVPLTAPGLAATGLIVFVLSWNMLLIPLLLTSVHIKTIPVVVSGFFYLEREIDWSSAAAILMISLGPLLVLVLAAHRVLERFTLTPVENS